MFTFLSNSFSNKCLVNSSLFLPSNELTQITQDIK